MYIYLTLALHFFLHDALPISFSIIFQVEPAKSFILKFLTFRSPQETLDVHSVFANACLFVDSILPSNAFGFLAGCSPRSEEHTSELQSRRDIVCRLLLEKKKT